MNNYSGAEYPVSLGQLGLLTDLSPSDIPPGAMISAWNVTLNDGRIQKAPGSLAYNTNALDSGIVAIFDWWPNTITQRMICVTALGNVYRDNGLGTFSFNGGNPLNETPLTGLTPNAQFVAGGSEQPGNARKLFLFTFGQNPIQVLEDDGSTITPVANPAVDWAVSNYPKCGVVHRNRLFAFSKQFAYGSHTDDHEDFTGSNALTQPIFPGEGGDIIGAFVYKGRLFAFKDGDFVYWLDDSSLDSDDWTWLKIASNFGLSAPNAIIEALDDMFSGNSTGTVTSFGATNALGDVAAGDVFSIAQMEGYLRGTSSKVGTNVQHAVYYPEKKLAFFTYRSGYYTYNDMLVIIDVNKKAQVGPRVYFWQKGRPQCLGLRKDATNIQRPMYGSSDGRIYLMDREDCNEGGVAYSGEFQTPFMNCGMAEKNKSFDWLAVEYVPSGDITLLCDYFIDGKYMDTVSFSMAQYESPVLDTFLLDANRLAQISTETGVRRLGGSGRTISFRFRNGGINESFQLVKFTIGFRPSGEQAQKATSG